MKSVTTVQLNKAVVKALRQRKKYQRETYNEVILSLIEEVEKKSNSQYDSFLHEIQKKKMKELWDNEADTAWEDV